MAKLESQPLSAEERAELEELRAEKARREAQEEARREREELAALRAERAKAEEPRTDGLASAASSAGTTTRSFRRTFRKWTAPQISV